MCEYMFIFFFILFYFFNYFSRVRLMGHLYMIVAVPLIVLTLSFTKLGSKLFFYKYYNDIFIKIKIFINYFIKLFLNQSNDIIEFHLNKLFLIL